MNSQRVLSLRNMLRLACIASLAAACAARPAPASPPVATPSPAPSPAPSATASILLTGISINRFSEIDAALDAAWRKLNPAGEMVWTPARTPFFASEGWPTPQTVWTSYAFAYGRSVNGALADGQHVAHPWAAITYDAASNTLQVTTLGATLIDTGEIQGVRPLNEADIALLKRGPEMQRWVLTHPKWPQWNNELTDLQQFYVTWLAHNGVIGARITPAHEDFINNWVNVTVN